MLNLPEIPHWPTSGQTVPTQQRSSNLACFHLISQHLKSPCSSLQSYSANDAVQRKDLHPGCPHGPARLIT